GGRLGFRVCPLKHMKACDAQEREGRHAQEEDPEAGHGAEATRDLRQSGRGAERSHGKEARERWRAAHAPEGVRRRGQPPSVEEAPWSRKGPGPESRTL